MTPFRYTCTLCNRSFARDEVRYLCPDCGQTYRPGMPLRGVLEVTFDAEALRRSFDPARPSWDVFSAGRAGVLSAYAVGGTPLTPAARLGKELGRRPAVPEERRPEPERFVEGPCLVSDGGGSEPAGRRADRDGIDGECRERSCGGVRGSGEARGHLRPFHRAPREARTDPAVRRHARPDRRHVRRCVPLCRWSTRRRKAG